MTGILYQQCVQRSGALLLENQTFGSGNSYHYLKDEEILPRHPTMVRKSYLMNQILRKTDLTSRMVSWVMELSEYEISFTPRRSIKSQVLEDFLIELSAPLS